MTAGLTRSRFLAASAAALTLAARPLRAQQLHTIQLVGSFDDALTPVCWASHTGAYQRAGLGVELVASNSGTAATAAVISGTYALGKGSAPASLNAHLRGLPVTVIANGGLWDPRSPNSLAVVAADSPLRRPRDLSGKLAATAALNDLTTLMIAAWVDQDGGDSKTIRWIELPAPATAEALAEHRIDVGQIWEPLLTAALQSGKVRLLGDGRSSDAISNSYVISLYFTSADFAKENPQLLRTFARVTYEAARYTNGHSSDTWQLMSDTLKMPLDVIRQIHRQPGATSGDPALLQPLIDCAARYGNIARAFPARELYFDGA